MTNEELEQEIYSVYQWFASEAPGVVVKEEGQLRSLWSEFDLRVASGEIEIG